MTQSRPQTSVIDSVSSGLFASVIVVGVLVFSLTALWFGTRGSSGNLGFPARVIHEAGRGDHAAGWEKDIAPPGSEESETLNEPNAEQLVQAITQASSEVASSFVFSNSEGDANLGPSGNGDNRPPGPLGEGDDVIPMHQRWELRFQAGSLAQYAAQLDHHGIELACVGRSTNIDYVSSVSKSPQKRSGTTEVENRLQRLFFVWRTDNPLKQFDEQLLSQARIKTQGRLILKFCSAELKQQMARLESEKLFSSGRSSIKHISRTVFESRPTTTGFELTIVEQTYR
ncbi:MAG: hypothetical protein U0930_22685 [Pirellulales bacterium]